MNYCTGLMVGSTASMSSLWSFSFNIGISQSKHVSSCVTAIETGDTRRNKRLKVLVNPVGGPGRAKALWIKTVEPIFRSAGCILDVTCELCNSQQTI